MADLVIIKSCDLVIHRFAIKYRRCSMLRLGLMANKMEGKVRNILLEEQVVCFLLQRIFLS